MRLHLIKHKIAMKEKTNTIDSVLMSFEIVINKKKNNI